MAPPKSRLPTPWEVVCLIANDMAFHGNLHAARLVVVMFCLYLRPVELLGFVGKQLVPPLTLPGHDLWSMVLFPQEAETTSRTGEQDESLLLDLPFFQFLALVLRILKDEAGVEGAVSHLSYAQLAAVYRAAGVRLGLEGPPTLYQLRHGGAASDLAARRRVLAEIKARGRWHDDRSLARHTKGGRVTEQLSKLPAGLLAFAARVERQIGNILSGRSPPLRQSCGCGSRWRFSQAPGGCQVPGRSSSVSTECRSLSGMFAGAQNTI